MSSRSKSFWVATAVCALGVLAAIVSLFVPWAVMQSAVSMQFGTTGSGPPIGPPLMHGTMSAFNLPGGRWYFTVLLVIAVLVAAGATGIGWLRRVAQLGGIFGGLAGAAVIVALAGPMNWKIATAAQGFATVTTGASPRPGYLFGAAAALLLGLGATLLGYSRRPEKSERVNNGGRHRG